MKRQALYFRALRQVEVIEEECPALKAGQLLVETTLTAISSGTEMLFYRGQAPADLSVDSTITGLQGQNRYPIKYGYCCVGKVVDTGLGSDQNWLGRRVFSFHPHESLFCAGPDDLFAIPDSLSAERAVFIPNMETAVNLVMDGRPLIGEFVALFGLGIVGLMTSALLSQFPLAGMAGFDRYPLRRQAGLEAGLQAAFDPGDSSQWHQARSDFSLPGMVDGYDLSYEISGSPNALDLAIRLCGFSSRVVVGSWYGSKRVQLDLGGKYHRDRVQMMSSQVSSIAPELRGRWDKPRRFVEVFRQLNRIQPERWITHRFPVTAAPDIYKMLDETPSEAIQVVFTY